MRRQLAFGIYISVLRFHRVVGSRIEVVVDQPNCQKTKDMWVYAIVNFALEGLFEHIQSHKVKIYIFITYNCWSLLSIISIIYFIVLCLYFISKYM